MKWKVITTSGRNGYFVHADTEEDAVKKAQVSVYQPLQGSFIGVEQVPDEYDEIDTRGD